MPGSKSVQPAAPRSRPFRCDLQRPPHRIRPRPGAPQEKTMTKFLATLLATSLLVLTAAPAMALSNAEKCGPDGPEVYKRAGGYCEQINNKGSMVESKSEKDDYQVE